MVRRRHRVKKKSKSKKMQMLGISTLIAPAFREIGVVLGYRDLRVYNRSLVEWRLDWHHAWHEYRQEDAPIILVDDNNMPIVRLLAWATLKGRQEILEYARLNYEDEERADDYLYNGARS
jgi:hypothetical protein